MTSASFHAIITVIAQVFPALLEVLADGAEEEQKMMTFQARLLMTEQGRTFHGPTD